LLKHAQKNKTLNKYLTSKLQFSPNFTLDSIADSNYRGGFLIFEWTILIYKRLFFRFSCKYIPKTMTTMKAKGENVQIWQTHVIFYNRYKTIVCLNSKFPPPVELCWQNKNISKLGILITKVGNIIIL
jgi:hypothetical protein